MFYCLKINGFPGEFSCFEWSPCEKKLLYVAEKKQPKAEPFYPSKPKDKDSTVPEEKLPKKVALIKFEENGKKLSRHYVVCIYLLESDLTY